MEEKLLENKQVEELENRRKSNKEKDSFLTKIMKSTLIIVLSPIVILFIGSIFYSIDSFQMRTYAADKVKINDITVTDPVKLSELKSIVSPSFIDNFLTRFFLFRFGCGCPSPYQEMTWYKDNKIILKAAVMHDNNLCFGDVRAPTGLDFQKQISAWLIKNGSKIPNIEKHFDSLDNNKIEDLKQRSKNVIEIEINK